MLSHIIKDVWGDTLRYIGISFVQDSLVKDIIDHNSKALNATTSLDSQNDFALFCSISIQIVVD